MEFEAGMLVELMGFSADEGIGDELDFAGLVTFGSLGGGEDGEEFPIHVVDGVFDLGF